MIEDQILVPSFVWKCLSQLLCNPVAGRLLANTAMQNTASVMGNDEEAVEHAKSKRGYGEKIHRGNHLAMILEEGLPSLSSLRVLGGALHPPRDRSLGNIETQLEQFAMDARCAPGGILGSHLEDQLPQLFGDLFPARRFRVPAQPTPIQAKSSAMPTHNGFRRKQKQRILPIRPSLTHQQPEDPIPCLEARSRLLALEN